VMLWSMVVGSKQPGPPLPIPAKNIHRGTQEATAFSSSAADEWWGRSNWGLPYPCLQTQYGAQEASGLGQRLLLVSMHGGGVEATGASVTHACKQNTMRT
jgi:hypothetical protein